MLTISDGRSDLWQWDTGRTINVPDGCSQVHFSNKVFGRSIDVDVVGGVAIIPDILLQTDKELTAWAFVGTPENGYTKTSKSFKVNRRNKPADYVFTPTDQTTLNEIMERIDRVEESQDPDAIKNAVDEYLENNPVHVEETDPTVPEWAKAATKPTYTAQEVGALPADTEIPEAYTLPPATADTLGGVKVGDGLQMDGDVLEAEVQKEDIDKIYEEIDAISNLEATTNDAVVKVEGWTKGRIDSGEHKANAAMAYSELMPNIGQYFHFDDTKYKILYITYWEDGTKSYTSGWLTESPVMYENLDKAYIRVQLYTLDASKITDAMLADLPNEVTYTVAGQGATTATSPIVQAVLDLSAANVPPRYVDGTTGSDSNPGTADAPFATIQKGVDSGAKLLYVETGEYAEYVRITNRDELTIMPTAYPGTYDIAAPETPMIHITGTEDSRIGRALYITNCGKISIIGVWGDYTTYETIHAVNVKDLTMIGCYASNSASEMSGFKTNNTNAVFRRCKAWNVGKDGFGLSGHGDVRLYDCIAHDCDDDGVSHHNSNTGIIVGGEFYNCGKGGVSSPTYGAYIDVMGVYSHDNVYGLYAMNDMDRRESVGKICGCVFINNTTADLRIGQNCRVTGWNNIYQTKSVMDAATYVEIGATGEA